MTTELDIDISDPIQIEVTQDDIDNGVRREGESCPIALAMTRAGYGAPKVDYRRWSADTEHGRMYGLTSERTRLWLVRYDDGNTMEPDTLTLYGVRIMSDSQKTDS